MPTVLLDTTDLAEAQVALSANYSKTRISGDFTAPTSLSIKRRFVGSLGIDSVDYGCAFSYVMEPPEQIVICRVVSGGLEAGHPQQPSAVCRTGDIYAFGAVEGASYSGCFQPGHYDNLVVDRGWLSRVAAGNPDIDIDAPVRLTGSVSVSRESSRRLFHGIAYASRIAADGDAKRNPLVADGLERYLATLLLGTFPNTAVPADDTPAGSDGSAAVLRRAMTYIDDQAHTAISLADIATAVHLTPRAVQYMFRKHRDCTPMEYVRRVRLSRAHHDLVANNPGATSVSSIARGWGFAHAGRFAAYYRKVYGQSPHLTLRS